MISCFSLCYGSLELYNIRNQMYIDNDMQNFYYVRSENTEETISFIENEIGLPVMSFGYTSGPDTDTSIVLYSKSALENIQVLTSKGENIDLNKDYGDQVPCLITSKLAKRYDVGESQEIKTEDGEGIGDFYICGVIKNDCLFSPNYGFDYDTDCIIAYDPNGLIEKNANYMEFYAINASGVDDFSETYSEYISSNAFQSFEYYYKARNELERDIIMPYIMLTITFVALSITGLISYTVLSLESAKRLIGIQYLCGAKLWQLLFVFLIKNVVICILPMIISVPVINAMRGSDLSQTTLISWRGYLVASALCFLGLIISSVLHMIRINRHRVIETLKSL